VKDSHLTGGHSLARTVGAWGRFEIRDSAGGGGCPDTRIPGSRTQATSKGKGECSRSLESRVCGSMIVPWHKALSDRVPLW